MLTQKEIRHLFSYNKATGILRWKIKPSRNVNIGDEAGTLNTDGYLHVRVKSKIYKVHRLIWCGVYGYWPENDIDHKDKIKHHNWLSNLREASKTCNNRNCGIRKDNTSGIKGISFDKNKWKASIRVNKKLYHIGYHKDFDEAVCHRLAAEQCLDWHGCDTDSSALRYVKENICQAP